MVVDMRIKKLLELRKKLKSKKPIFRRTLWWKFKKFGKNAPWRKPRGIDNKIRQKLKGYPPMPDPGYGSPKEVRGLHPSGLKPIVIYNVKDLEKIDDPSKYIVYIAHCVGAKKRLQIIEEAKKRGIRIANA